MYERADFSESHPKYLFILLYDNDFWQWNVHTRTHTHSHTYQLRWCCMIPCIHSFCVYFLIDYFNAFGGVCLALFNAKNAKVVRLLRASFKFVVQLPRIIFALHESNHVTSHWHDWLQNKGENLRGPWTKKTATEKYCKYTSCHFSWFPNVNSVFAHWTCKLCWIFMANLHKSEHNECIHKKTYVISDDHESNICTQSRPIESRLFAN